VDISARWIGTFPAPVTSPGRHSQPCIKAIAAITLEVVKRTDTHSSQVVRRSPDL
jgi:hypothetical protein